MWVQGLSEFLRDERGLEVVEYSILAGLLVAGIVATIAAIGTWVSGVYSALKAAVGA
jgi:Flp pilus assembly pilin Flp